MKRVWHHPEIEDDGAQSWVSTGQLEDTQEFRAWAEREFPQGLAELDGEEDAKLSRRSFLRFMGASTALAGFGSMAACRKPASQLIPFKDNVEWAVPGKPLYYSTMMSRGDWSWPVVATTIDGRPTMLAGNRHHPHGSTALDHFGTAEVIELYDPDRSRHYTKKQGEKEVVQSSKADFDAWFADFQSQQMGTGKQVGFLLGEGSTPTEERLLGEIAAAYPEAKFFRYEALSQANRRQAQEQIYGQGVRVVPKFAEAKRVLSLDCDFLHLEMPSPDARIAFHKAHKPEDAEGKKKSSEQMARLYSVESAYSLTGGMADHRLRLTYAGILRFAVALSKKVAQKLGNSQLANLVNSVNIEEQFDSDQQKFQSDWLEECASDLVSAQGAAIVLAGQKHGLALHLLCEALNAALEAPQDQLKRPQLGKFETGDLNDLYQAIGKGQIKTIFSTSAADPVYDAPRDQRDFASTLKGKVDFIHWGLHHNATAKFASWHIPAAHFLESWNDGWSAQGRYGLAQPMIEPLYQGESSVDFLMRFLPQDKQENSIEDATQSAVEKERLAIYQTFEQIQTLVPAAEGEASASNLKGANPVLASWEQALRQGFSENQLTLEPAKPNLAIGSQLSEAIQIDSRPLPAEAKNSDSGKDLEIVFSADASLWDGRYANNGWLQEAPDPVTKLTWDNAALISAETAIELGPKIGMPNLAEDLGANRAIKEGAGEEEYEVVKDNDKAHAWKSKDVDPPIVSITVNGQSIDIPLLLAFGHANNTITVHLGYGRKAVGKVGDGLDGNGVGFDVNPLRIARTPFVGTIEKIAPSQNKDLKGYQFALTSEHHTMYGRGLAVEAPLETGDEKKGRGYLEEGFSTKAWMDAKAPDSPAMYRAEDWKGKPLINDELHQWGMVIDLTSCIGCNSCLVACQAENNIPIVGKEQVRRGREMHWIRMDRYFSSRSKARKTYDKEGKKIKDTTSNPDPGNPEMLTQPVACQQCEYAPCETVCPVNATVHSEDGLNLMAYNRCIGTRYCANNCPYKARRFNFFDYNKRPLDKLYQGPLAPAEGLAEGSLKLQKNPNVTVRMRGVMEKCTYCIQRLQEAKIDAKAILPRKTLEEGKRSELVTISNEELRVPTGGVSVACQDACPSEAIVFGNLLDKKDPITKLKHFEQVGQTRQLVAAKKGAGARSYDLLAYLGARPRTSYLARVRNLNPNLAESKFRGEASVTIS